MHKGFCQSVVGLKKGFDAEIGDMVSQVKATVRFSCPVTSAGIYHERDIIILTPEEYEALTTGKNYLVPQSVIEGLKTVSHMTLDLLKSCETTGETGNEKTQSQDSKAGENKQ